MSNENANNNADMNHRRRGSVTQQALAGLFRSNSTSVGQNYQNSEAQRRRLSVATTGIGLAGTSPTNPSPFTGFRRGSMSTNSDSFDENAIDEEEVVRAPPTTPFARRMSFGAPAMRNVRPGGGSPSAPNDQGFNWSEQLKSRAESSVQGPRPSFSFGSTASTSPPRGNGNAMHDRAKSVSDMPAPPAQAAAMKPKAPEPQRKKPDAFQERILKGDFYMD
ncbi:hypothetical protein BN1723_013306 [Verticillium longisporum]|uniref:Uncharacterized protein n=1 Tax=Verticillium longisporum TaxID=100787 RepID=A0A0G4L1A6_VERLO|nr:hypothetical protein BN1708_011565 [Verticillium longisporum]CRK24463.1 hypothetical protein BN1723_013306 [Verticillium longisporum]